MSNVEKFKSEGESCKHFISVLSTLRHKNESLNEICDIIDTLDEEEYQEFVEIINRYNFRGPLEVIIWLHTPGEVE